MPWDTARAIQSTRRIASNPAHLLTVVVSLLMDPILRIVLLISLIVWTILNVILIVQIDF